MNLRDRIIRTPEVLNGKPVVKGTRISVELVLERLGSGWTEKDLLESLPTIDSKDIKACLLLCK